MSTSPPSPPHVVEDFYGVVQILSDGTVVRGDEEALQPQATYPDVPGVEWKDVVYHAAHGLRARVYRPSSSLGKLPVLVYFHGGGYCLGSFAQPMFHTFCLRAAAELPALVLSVQYRLAPEHRQPRPYHRLPAAIEDGADFLSWLRGQAELAATGGADPWPAESADFPRTFISGVSASANLAHHVTVQLASAELAVSPVCVVGYVLLFAFFGSAERTAAETEPPADVSLTVDMSDQLWHMSLPVGASRDHPVANPGYHPVANPFGPDSPSLTAVDLPPALVVVPGSDVLRDHVRGCAARLKDMGKTVEVVEFAGEQHGFSVLQPFGEAADELMRVLRRFVYAGHSA
ncbi:probable carboxylesterase 15 [Lolium rigidum]|uniref:probable carboxylesterase 15 n=1 Tax=Lolium rigidum TaxID=89674 RepID=UPI001F5DD8D4|nr:probable carboxylesterase 15 [Lolium rigidum]